MSERPTPETDAVAAHEGNWDTKALRMTAHARKLERERDEAREDATNYYARIGELESERDEALELVSELKRKISDYCDEQLRLVFENRRLHQERDEALEHLRDIKEYGTEEINAAVELRQKLAAALVERDQAREDAHHNAARANANAAECCRAWRERNEAREALENHAASTIHTCHDKCKRPMCVLRRERDEARNLVDHYREQKDLLPISWDV